MTSREARMIKVLMGSADGIVPPQEGGEGTGNNPFGAKERNSIYESSDRRTPEEEWDDIWDINN